MNKEKFADSLGNTLADTENGIPQIVLESSPKAIPSGEIVVDRVGFEPTTFWSFDLLRDPEGLQTRRSAGLIYRPTVAGLSVPRAF